MGMSKTLPLDRCPGRFGPCIRIEDVVDRRADGKHEWNRSPFDTQYERCLYCGLFRTAAQPTSPEPPNAA